MQRTEEEEAIDRLVATASAEGRLTSLNIDGRWNADRWEDVVRVSVAGGAPRGALCLQDVRWTAPQAEQWTKQMRWRWERDHGCKSHWAFALGPLTAAQGEGSKPMGGSVVGVWGDWCEVVVSPGPERDPLGRWAVIWLRGRHGGGVAIFSAYRPPSGAAGGLVDRHQTLLGARNQAEVQAAFYRDLTAAVALARGSGYEAVVAGDFNADPRGSKQEDRALAAWCLQQGLAPAGGSWSGAGTYVFATAGGKAGESSIDHILTSTPGLLRGTEKPVEIGQSVWGHRLLTAHWGAELVERLCLAKDERARQAEWRAGKRAVERARRGRHRRIEKKAGVRYRHECGELPAGLAERIATLEQMAVWCRGWWQCEEEVVEAVPEGLELLAEAEGWLGATKGSVREAAREMATQAEAAMLAAMMRAAQAASPVKGRAASRRTMVGWYPGIANDRRVVGHLGHALAAARRGHWEKAGRRGVLGGVGSPVPAGGDIPYAQWLAAAERELRAAKGRKQGHVRRAWERRNKQYWDRLKAAALAGEAGTMARTLRGRRQPHALRRVVRRSDGTEARGAKEVQQATSDHFRAAFGGAGGAQAGSLGELLADSPTGRRRRREVATGALPATWGADLGEDQRRRVKEMVARKVVGGLALETGWHGDWLGPITAREWQEHWASRARASSAGASGAGVDIWKEAPEHFHEAACALYSACLRLLVQPRGWSTEVVVPIPKEAGALELGAMRPLKLLEVTKKAVMAVVKRRMRAELEAAGVLSNRQCGFRQGYSCHTAALRLLALLEGARRDKAECHVVALDIAKAYDTVERGWGLGVALERLGVADEVVEWLWAGARDNVNWVRTGWEELLRERGVDIPTFHARTGFTQGASESPLLWNLFFDMLLCQLEREGVGAEIVRSTVEGEGAGEGLGAFADDTVLVARSREETDAALRSVLEVFTLVGLRVAAHKSVHLCLRWVDNTHGRGAAMQLAEEDGVGVSMGGVRVPQVDYDVGFRYLGVWVDGAGDWGEEQARIEEIISGFCCTLEQLRVPAGVALYLYKAVLTPRVQYKLVLASLTGTAIDKLEDGAWRRLATRLGGWANMDKRLKHMAPEDGGLGLTPWSVQALERRVGLITQLSSHGEPWAHALLEELRVGWARDRGGSGRATLGACPTAGETKLEEASETSSWMRGTDALLHHLKLAWTPLTEPDGLGWREQDCELGSVWLPQTHAQARAVAAAGLCWLSDICDAGGAVLDFAQIPGWRFLGKALRAARERTTAAPLGAWRRGAADADGARPGSWVLCGDRLGWLRGWRKRDETWEGG